MTLPPFLMYRSPTKLVTELIVLRAHARLKAGLPEKLVL